MHPLQSRVRAYCSNRHRAASQGWVRKTERLTRTSEALLMKMGCVGWDAVWGEGVGKGILWVCHSFCLFIGCSCSFRAPKPEKLGPEVISYYLILAVGLLGLLFIG